MASYEKNDKNQWSVRFRIVGDDGRLVNKRLSGFDKKALAQRAYVEFMNSYIEPPKADRKHDITFSELFKHYVNYNKNEMKESSLQAYAERIQAHVLPYLGEMKINELSNKTISDFKDYLSKKTYIRKGKQIPYSHKYKSTIFESLVHLINYGIRFFNINSNVASRIGNFKNKSEINKEMSFWTKKEFDQFISSVDSLLYKTLFSFLYLTGCRVGEMCALQWKDIDFLKNTIKVNKTATRTSKSSMFYNITPPKTKNSNRIITMPSKLRSLLLEYKEEYYNKENDFIFGGERVFPRQTILNAMIKYCKLSNVKKIRIHDLRHSHVSLLINTGNNSLSLLYVIAKRIGDTPEMILQTYGHMFPDEQEKLISKLDEYL